MNIYFSQNLVYERDVKRGMTQKDMAAILGITIAKYASWEECRAFPDGRMIVQLIHLFKIKNFYNFLTVPHYLKEKGRAKNISYSL